jgi:hypothetical protein
MYVLYFDNLTGKKKMRQVVEDMEPPTPPKAAGQVREERKDLFFLCVLRVLSG